MRSNKEKAKGKARMLMDDNYPKDTVNSVVSQATTHVHVIRK